jgi:hypothetical protein
MVEFFFWVIVPAIAQKSVILSRFICHSGAFFFKKGIYHLINQLWLNELAF